MSIPVPLTVRIQTARADRHITADLRDLTFRETAPGGYASVNLSLSRPLNIQPDDLDYYAHIWVYDGRSGAVVCEGLVEDPRRAAGSDGQIWDIAAVGPAGRVLDRTVPYISVDQDLQSWKRVDAGNITGGSMTTCQDPADSSATGPQGIKLQFPQGTVHDNGSHISAQYERIWQAGQKLARFDYHWSGGGVDPSYLLFTEVTTNAAGTAERPRSEVMSSGAGSDPAVVVTDWTNGKNTMRLNYWRSAPPGPITTANDNYWVHVHGLSVLAMRYTAAGVEITSGYTTNTVLASDIVKDLLGRGLLPLFDGVNASVATTTYAIDQFAYPDGVTPGKLLDDLMVLEPAYYWEARATNPSTGKNQFNWKAWPTTVRYEASVVDGFDSPGSAAELYNAVRVRYTDVDGQIRTVQRTLAVASLTAAGITREGFIDLGDTLGSAANANQVGDEFLDQHSTPPNAGTLTIARPIIDIDRARMCMPWEIEAGNLIRVRGVMPRVDSLNAADRDGSTVFRIVARDFQASSATATLELDSYSPSIARAIAKLGQRQVNRVRR